MLRSQRGPLSMVRTNNERGRLIGQSRITANLSKPLSIKFWVCAAASDNYYTPCGTMNWVKYYSEQEKYTCPKNRTRLAKCYAWDNLEVDQSYYYCGGTDWLGHVAKGTYFVHWIKGLS